MIVARRGVMSKARQIGQAACKVVAAIAGGLFLIAPLTDTGLTVMFVSLFVGVACLALHQYLDDDDTDSQFKLN
jgi:hypothetical protein